MTTDPEGGSMNSDHVRALIEQRARQRVRRHWGDAIGLNDLTDDAQERVRELALEELLHDARERMKELLAARVSSPPTISDDMAAFDEAIRSVEAWHSDDETVAAQYAGVREGLIRGREIALRRFCVCTPAIAGISDGPSVDCPTHGATTSGAF